MEKLLLGVIVSLLQIYSCILILRSLLYFSKMEPYHRIAKVCIRLTQPIIKPVQKIFPCVLGFETVSLFFSLVFIIIADFILLFWSVDQISAGSALLAALSVGIFSWFKYVLYVYFGALIVLVVLGLFEANSATRFYVDRILKPFTKPFQKLRIGMFDFSILPLLLLIQLYLSFLYPVIRANILPFFL